MRLWLTPLFLAAVIELPVRASFSYMDIYVYSFVPPCKKISGGRVILPKGSGSKNPWNAFFFSPFFLCGAECHATPTSTSTHHLYLPPIPSINHPVSPATHTNTHMHTQLHTLLQQHKQINNPSDHCQATGGWRTNEKTFTDHAGELLALFVCEPLVENFIGLCWSVHYFGFYG